VPGMMFLFRRFFLCRSLLEFRLRLGGCVVLLGFRILALGRNLLPSVFIDDKVYKICEATDGTLLFTICISQKYFILFFSKLIAHT